MCAFDDRWGTDTENWKEFNVFDSMGYIIARASNRTFLGKPACRDEKFLKLMATFAADVGRVIMTMQFIPKLLKPIVGRKSQIIGEPSLLYFSANPWPRVDLNTERISFSTSASYN